MDEYWDEIVENLSHIIAEAYEVYQPLVERACRITASQKEVEHLLDDMLSFAWDQRMLELYKTVCRRYFQIYPETVTSYIYEYRDMWEKHEEEIEPN